MGCVMKLSDVLRDVERYGKRAIGRSEYCAYLRGEPVTRGQAVRAKCYDCMGMYRDGLVDCDIKRCPLYPFMPYRDDKTSKDPISPDLASGGAVRGPGGKERVNAYR